MIRKGNEALVREFQGVSFDVLAVGEKSMVTKMRYRAGNRVELHSHPNEQSGYITSGSYRITISGRTEVLGPGDSYSIPENVPHSFEVIEPGEVIDVFTPIRIEYL